MGIHTSRCLSAGEQEAPPAQEAAEELEDFVEERVRRTSELLELFSQEQKWLDHAADVMAARRMRAKEEADAIEALEQEDATHQEELSQLEAYVRQMSEHCESGGTSSKPDVSKCQALEERIRRNNSLPNIPSGGTQWDIKSWISDVLKVKTLVKSGSTPISPLRRVKPANDSTASPATPSWRRNIARPQLPGQPGEAETPRKSSDETPRKGSETPRKGETETPRKSGSTVQRLRIGRFIIEEFEVTYRGQDAPTEVEPTPRGGLAKAGWRLHEDPAKALSSQKDCRSAAAVEGCPEHPGPMAFR
ncbi:hypothetical protein AK812_SmicGene23110 [Symbiodinium microadriaticum]|uniref:Uncharacterized protein n=1 Tax=Symbiodinium microadriaticum TaxID=2951 RepID=A0A1Q9DI21_SYMMI|nr:hypothetical protein AK812_SmicGene23110 [Symbiodinium microadriaticum]